MRAHRGCPSLALLLGVAAAVACKASTSSPRPTPAPTPESAAPAPGRPAADGPYFEFQVQRPVMPVSGNPAPHYPDTLRMANVAGEVLVQFVVDTLGHADMSTFRVLSSSHEMFTAAVREALPKMRYTPAELTPGLKVRQLVQQAFKFAVQ